MRSYKIVERFLFYSRLFQLKHGMENVIWCLKYKAKTVTLNEAKIAVQLKKSMFQLYWCCCCWKSLYIILIRHVSASKAVSFLSYSDSSLHCTWNNSTFHILTDKYSVCTISIISMCFHSKTKRCENERHQLIKHYNAF